MATSYDVVKEELDKADQVIKAKLVNIAHIDTLKAMINEAEIRVKHLQAVARVLDFLQGLQAELTAECVKAGVLKEHAESKSETLPTGVVDASK
jgi:trehalose/maltose hydrolase-like predicted phosphorylase